MFNKVVARFKDGSIMKGNTNDFSPLKRHFHLEVIGGQVIDVDVAFLKALEIDLAELKAAFFVKHFEGKKHTMKSMGIL